MPIAGCKGSSIGKRINTPSAVTDSGLDVVGGGDSLSGDCGVGRKSRVRDRRA